MCCRSTASFGAWFVAESAALDSASSSAGFWIGLHQVCRCRHLPQSTTPAFHRAFEELTWGIVISQQSRGLVAQAPAWIIGWQAFV